MVFHIPEFGARKLIFVRHDFRINSGRALAGIYCCGNHEAAINRRLLGNGKTRHGNVAVPLSWESDLGGRSCVVIVYREDGPQSGGIFKFYGVRYDPEYYGVVQSFSFVLQENPVKTTFETTP